MSHINEGDLQAYLDGAYEVLTPEQLAEIERLIEEDEAFAAQVEEARATRAAASRILGDAVPKEFAPPPFEELQRRAAAAPAAEEPEEPEKRRWIGLPPLVGMGWAATVVLALGVGWFVGQGAGDAQFGNFRDAASQSPLSEVEAELRSAPDVEARLERSDLASVDQDRGAEVDGSAANEALEDQTDAPADLVGRTTDDTDPGGFENRKAVGPLAGELSEEVTVESTVPVTLDEVGAAGAGNVAGERLEASSQVGAGGGLPAPPATAQRRGAAQEAPPEVAAKEEVDMRQSAARSSEEFAARQRTLPRADSIGAGQNATSLAEAGGARDALLRAPAEEHAFHSLAVPGLEVLSVTLDEAGELSGLMILHQLPAGDTLELRYVGLFSQPADPRGGVGLGGRVETETLPALSAQIREAALPPGWRQVVVRKENRWLVARAPISEAQLRAYLMTLN